MRKKIYKEIQVPGFCELCCEMFCFCPDFYAFYTIMYSKSLHDWLLWEGHLDEKRKSYKRQGSKTHFGHNGTVLWKVDVKIMSIVLYGARAKGDKTSQSVYEFLVLSNNDTPLDKFILFNETVKLELLSEKYLNVIF